MELGWSIYTDFHRKLPTNSVIGSEISQSLFKEVALQNFLQLLRENGFCYFMLLTEIHYINGISQVGK